MVYLCFLLLTCHDEQFCGGMDDIDFLKDGRRVVCQSLFAEVIHNEFESAIWTEGRPDDFCEFMDGVDVADNGYERISKITQREDLPSSAPCRDLYPS